MASESQSRLRSIVKAPPVSPWLIMDLVVHLLDPSPGYLIVDDFLPSWFLTGGHGLHLAWKQEGGGVWGWREWSRFVFFGRLQVRTPEGDMLQRCAKEWRIYPSDGLSQLGFGVFTRGEVATHMEAPHPSEGCSVIFSAKAQGGKTARGQAGLCRGSTILDGKPQTQIAPLRDSNQMRSPELLHLLVREYLSVRSSTIWVSRCQHRSRLGLVVLTGWWSFTREK